MNTLLVISLAIGLAGCQSSSESFEAAYREGKQYVYNYESQVLTGLPEGSKIYSGIKVRANVRFQFTSVSHVNLQIEEPIRLLRVNDQIDTADPTRDMVPTDLFKEIIDPDVHRMKTELVKPISFSYIRGHVDDLVTEEDDPFWSVNIKKGFLGFLELNFNERMSLQSFDDPVIVEHSDMLPKFYRVVEPSVTGECETSYWVRPDITTDGQTMMNILKVRNFERCIDRVFFFFDMFNGRYCDFCEPDMRYNPLTAQSSVRYNIVGSPSQFIIMNAFTESQYNFVPYSENAGRISSFTNQTIYLVDSRPVTTQIPSPGSPQKHELAIKGHHPDDKTGDQSMFKKQTEMKEKEINENYKMAVKALMAYEKFSHDKVEEEAGDVMIELRRLLRTLDKPRIEQLLGEVNSDNMKNARKALIDLLPVIGTFEGVDIVMDKLISEDPIINWPPSVFMSLALMPYPDVHSVERLIDFMSKKKFTDPIHKRSAWLSLGSHGFKIMKLNETEEKEFQRQQELIKELKDKSNVKHVRRDLNKRLQQLEDAHLQKIASYNTLRQKIIGSVMNLMKSPNPDDIILALKAVGNLGYIEFFPEVETVITNKDLPTLRRMQAIFCTRRMQHYIPDQVRRVLLPVYLDHRESEEIRMSAYLTLMNTNPPRPDLEIIARSVLNEPSYNVGALVWANLVALSNRTTTCNCIQSLARNTTLALRYARRFDWGLQFSNYMYYSSYSRHLAAGHSYQHALFFNSKERLPRGFAMVYRGAFLGQAANLIEIGMSARGLDSYLDELSKEAGSTSLPDVLSELLKPRKSRSVKQSEQEIKDIKQKLKIEPRVPDSVEGHIYFKLFGQELIYIDINTPEKRETSFGQPSDPQPNAIPRESSDSPASSLASSVFKFLKMFRSILYPVRHEMVITETGLPLYMKLDLIGAWKIDSDFRLERAVGPNKSMKDVILDFKPSGLFQLHCKMGIDLWYFRTGAVIRSGMYLNSPLLLSFTVDPAKTKFIMRLKDEKVLNPMKFESVPMTFFRHFPSEATRYPVYPEIKEILVVDGFELSPFSNEYGKDWFGRIFSITGKRPIPRLDNVAVCPMTGKSVIFTEYKPLNPTGWELQFQHVSEKDGKITAMEQPSQDSSWWPFGSWFSDSNHMQHQEQADISGESGSSSESQEAGPSSFDLEQKDLSIQDLKMRFAKYTKFLNMADKCGFILRLAEPGTNPLHDVQISTFYQRDKPGLEELYTVEFRRAPIPKMETTPWKMVTDIRMKYPSTVIEPSDLLSDLYQQHVQKQIQISVYNDERQNDTLLDLDTLSLSQAVEHLLKLTQPSSESSTMEDLINHVMQNIQDPDLQVLKEIIQKQRQLHKEVKELSKQPTDIKNRLQFSLKCQELIGKSEQIVKKLNSKLDKTVIGQQQPEESAACHSVVLSVQKTIRKLEKILEKIGLILPPSEQSSLQKKLDGLKNHVKSVRQKQGQHSVSKQSQELVESQLEVEPEQRDLYRSLLELERQVIQASQNMLENPGDLKLAKPYLEKIARKTEDAKEVLDQTLIKDGILNRPVRVKAVEVALQHQLVAEDLEAELSKPKSEVPSMHSSEEIARQDVRKLQITLKKMSMQIIRRIHLAVNALKEGTIAAAMPQTDQDDMKVLHVSEVKQIQAIEHLKELEKEKPERSSKIQDLQKAVEVAEQIHNSIRPIVEREEQMQKSSLSPVLIKTLEVLSKQALIVEKVRQSMKHCEIQSFSDTAPVSSLPEQSLESQVYSPKLVPGQMIRISSSPEDLKLRVENLEKESLKLLKKINHLLSKKSSPEIVEQIPNQIPAISPVESPRHLLQKVHMVQAQQLEQESIVHSMIKTQPKQPSVRHSMLHSGVVPEELQGIVTVHYGLQRTTMRKIFMKALEKVPSTSKMFNQFSDVYEILGGMARVQNSQEEAQNDLKSALAASPPEVSKMLEGVCSQLTDSMRQQQERIMAFESKLRKHQQDSSLQMALQRAQQLQDHIQRLNIEQQSLEQNLQSFDHVQPKQPFLQHSISQSAVVPGDIQGIVTVQYGLEGTTLRKIFVKIFGKKTIEQLIWEQQQSLLGKQDEVVREYLEEQEQPNDRMSPAYHKLKKELNMYKHWQILCAYDKERVAVAVRRLFWKVHEYFKYRFYPKSMHVMPDSSNIANNFEIVSELRRDMRSMDLDVRTPYETTRFRNLHVPDPCRVFVTPNTETYLTNVLKHLTKDKLPATCEISNLRIKTHDQLRYEVPSLSPTCKKILSMDCSEDSKYVVMSQPSQFDVTHKDITLLTKNEKIEIVQEPSGPSVKVNNQKVDLVSPLSVRNEDGTIVSIEKSQRKVFISNPKLSLYVSSDGKNAIVKIDQYYWSKVCGLCGNLDSNPSNDFEGPNNVKFPDGPTMAAAYLVSDEKCNAEAIQRKLGVPEIRTQSKTIPPVQQTKVIEKQRGSVRKTCFSTSPVKRCPENTTPGSIMSRLVSYHCLDSSSPATQNLVTRSHSHILDEVRYKAVDATAYVSEPMTCVTQ